MGKREIGGAFPEGAADPWAGTCGNVPGCRQARQIPHPLPSLPFAGLAPTRTLAAGLSTCTDLRMVAPSLVTVTSFPRLTLCRILSCAAGCVFGVVDGWMGLGEGGRAGAGPGGGVGQESGAGVVQQPGPASPQLRPTSHHALGPQRGLHQVGNGHGPHKGGHARILPLLLRRARAQHRLREVAWDPAAMGARGKGVGGRGE